MSKYEASDGLASAELPYYRGLVAAIAERLPDRSARLLDVGSAGGDSLALFKGLGFTNLTGFDPSPRCAAFARERHGLRVINTPISEMPFAGEQFDVVMLSGVLEHVRDLSKTIGELRRLLPDDGMFWFGVPDARRFRDYIEAPFQHFSVEHINFFTRETLQALMRRAGFALVDAWESVHEIGAMPEPGLNALFRSATIDAAVERDCQGLEAVLAYVAASSRLEDRLWSGLQHLVEDRTPVVIWGTGSLTLHLMGTERFRRLNVAAFVDSNANYWNKTIEGVPVIAPLEMRTRSETILVISYSYENEIALQIRDVYRLPNPTVLLFGSIELHVLR